MKSKPKPSSTSKLTSRKAGEILRDGSAHGKPLTPKQQRFMGVIYSKGKSQD